MERQLHSEIRFSGQKDGLADRKTIKRTETQLHERKDILAKQFIEWKDSFTNGRTVLRMEGQYEWRDSFTNEKTVLRMERYFYEWKNSSTNGTKFLRTERQFYTRKTNLTEEIKFIKLRPRKTYQGY